MDENQNSTVSRRPRPNAKKEAAVKDKKEALAITKDIVSNYRKLRTIDKDDCLKELGVGTDWFTCVYCGDVKNRAGFYSSTEPYNTTGVSRICKKCCETIAYRIDESGDKNEPNKTSVDQVLYLLNKPMLDTVWQASILEANDETNAKSAGSSVWSTYAKNIAMQNYYTMTYRDSDTYGLAFVVDEHEGLPKDEEIRRQFDKNKNDTLRLLGYLPFEKENISDQPFLYAQLIGFLDSSEEGNDDMMRTSSIISIVRGFLQISQIDDMIADLVRDPRNAEKNIATVKALQEMKKNITINVTKLAEQSCISLKNSKNATKGENTWTGKLKKLKELDIREANVNAFDIETCKGMQQVADISMEAIIKKLNLQEDEMADMIAEQRRKLVDETNKAKSYAEAVRLLLAENIELRKQLENNSLLDESTLVDLDDVVSRYIERNAVM